jgi:type I restriction enzyme M protein
MLSNPPYGKSWKTDQSLVGKRGEVNDRRFVVQHGDELEMSLLTRSSDGQLMFLVNKLSKMKRDTPLGSRIAEVHNGSSLFTGDAGSGESNIRRWIIENDWLEAIVALPQNIFYNTGIATYIWVLTNRKPEHRRGTVQLIDAGGWFRPLRRNLGKKNCELSDEDIRRICETFLSFEESAQSKVFPNEAFGYWKVTVERPLRLQVTLDEESLARLRTACAEAKEQPLASLLERVAQEIGAGPHRDYTRFSVVVEQAAGRDRVKLTAKRLRLLRETLAERDETAAPVIRRAFDPKRTAPDPIYGRYALELNGESFLVEYEPDPLLRDSEQIPLLEDGGIEAFITREVLPHASDAWVDASSTRIGYEISFTRYFYQPKPLRSLTEIKADIYALEQEAEGLLEQIVGAR